MSPRTCLHDSKHRCDNDFPALLRQFSLEYTKYSREKFPCVVKKTLAASLFLAYEERFKDNFQYLSIIFSFNSGEKI